MKNLIYTVLIFMALTGCGGGGGHSGSNEAPIPSATQPQAAPGGALNPETGPQTGAASGPRSTASSLAQLRATDSLDRSSSISGPDLDGDGVRDDINRWIDSQSFTEQQKKAVIQKARTMQQTLLVDSANKAAARAIAERNFAAIDCVWAAFEAKSPIPSELTSRLEAMTANTRERAQRYIQYNAALGGMAFDMPSEPNCD